eukprot:m.32653 g.32653  ORF g.32653 m.32653 type:complete len:246 (-) comp9542_c0_seq1:285-1022(-)
MDPPAIQCVYCVCMCFLNTSFKDLFNVVIMGITWNLSLHCSLHCALYSHTCMHASIQINRQTPMAEVTQAMSQLALQEQKRDCISKQTWYMGMAILASKRSKDPNTQVGCVIVDPNGIVVSTGYNGFPVGCSDDELPWEKTGDTSLETKFPYVCHAEMNSILNTNDQIVRGCTLYATLFPCNECAKMIIQAGIEKVVYLCNKSKHKPLTQASRRMFDLAGVAVEEFSETPATLTINFSSLPPPFH